MKKLSAEDLFTLERYARERNAFRARVIAHKANRQLAVGPHLRWCFEDRLTIQYQVQEMLRTERIFESEAIAQELESYIPLIPDGSNWKVTLLIEYPDPEERRVELGRLKGVEDGCWIQVSGHERVFALADEDLERENDEKTSAVHFLRFELDPGDGERPARRSAPSGRRRASSLSAPIAGVGCARAARSSPILTDSASCAGRLPLRLSANIASLRLTARSWTPG